MRKLDEMLGKGEGRRALRLTSLSFPVEEEICNTGLSHGQKGGGGWGNEDYARLRSFLVWETVFAHKQSCEQAFFRLSPLPPSTVHSISKSNMAGQIIDRELLNLLRRADDEDERSFPICKQNPALC